MPEFPLEKIAPFRWRLAESALQGMRVPGEIFASDEMIPRIIADKTPQQVAGVATLPGIVRASFAMPDIHWGYGFPIGGVAAFDLDKGVVSPGGVGYDINCGVTLIRSNLQVKEIFNQIPKLTDALFDHIPCGVGSEGKIKLSQRDQDEILSRGAEWVVKAGYADHSDLDRMEDHGRLDDNDPSLVSARTRQRAERQLGTLGSGNHFIEIQKVVDIYDEQAAQAFGLWKGQILVMIHSGSRGLGHQICEETLKIMQGVVRREGIDLPDRQLACAPIRSTEGENYLKAMRCAANFAWANRLTMVGLVRQTFASFYKKPWQSLDMNLVYDVCHNIAQIESHTVEGKKRQLCVHRKGATRALGPGDPRIPDAYRSVGQPILIPGDMGRASYVLAGTNKAEELTFSSSCHGAGRLLSRHAAINATRGEDIVKQLAAQGVFLRAKEKGTIHEEVPQAYKDAKDVTDVVVGAGVSKLVARMKPLGVVKG